MKIYTKTGDNGTTGLFAGPRVPKDDPRIAAYGSVDELNALLGVILSQLDPPVSSASGMAETLCESEIPPTSALAQLLIDIQGDLFSIGAQLATPDPEAHGMCLLAADRIACLEHTMDAYEQELPPLSSFILPGGSPGSALLHFARTVCRRAEREVVSLSRVPGVQRYERPLIYLNRLSDLLFLMARKVNAQLSVHERAWNRPETP